MSPIEIELKFQVPAAARAGVRRALATASARTAHLRAIYVDTTDQRLAAAGLALRLRKEGRRWVQTLKGRGDGVMQRLEHEVARPLQRGTPAIDPGLHAGTPVGDALAALLADGAALLPRFRTDVRRVQRRLHGGGAAIEVAFDEGRITADGRALPVCEVEFELLAGTPAALVALAERWTRRHGLWLDVRSKAERGHRLALGEERAAVTMAAPPVMPGGATPAQAIVAMLNSALAQLLPNMAEVAAGDGAAEHLHQARVALRRLRTALRLFATWSADPALAAELEGRCGETFARLGAARDVDALAATLLPALAAAGAPPLSLAPPADAEEPAAVLREPSFSATLLRVLQLALAEPGAISSTLADAAGAVLKPAWRELLADSASFAGASPPSQHRTRRRLKRLRYATEFLLAVLPAKPARRALDAMRQTLDALGAYNDVLVASTLFERQIGRHPQAWFALGWLAARRERLLRKAARRLRALAREPRFWP
jgi:triphosphatase